MALTESGAGAMVFNFTCMRHFTWMMVMRHKLNSNYSSFCEVGLTHRCVQVHSRALDVERTCSLQRPSMKVGQVWQN